MTMPRRFRGLGAASSPEEPESGVFCVKSPVTYLRILVAGVVPLLLAASPGSAATVSQGDGACAPCATEGEPGDLFFGHAHAESIGAVCAMRNAEAISEAASASGIFDDHDADGSLAERARLLFQLRAWDGLRLVAELALSSPGSIIIGSDDALEPLRERYENVAVYPLRFIRGARLGHGAFCLQYDIPSRYDEVVRIGALTLRTGTRTVKLADRGEVRLLLKEYPLGDGDTVDMLLESTVCGEASITRIEDRGDSLELVTVHGLRGIYVRKAGVHRLGALMVWRSLPDMDDRSQHFRAGACAYFPKLTFALPLFLPDVGLDDLRDFEYPQPIVPRSWLLYPQRYLPRWLKPTASGVLAPSPSRGPRPRILERLFPDL